MVSRGHLLENDFSTININRFQISSQLTLNDSNYPHFRSEERRVGKEIIFSCKIHMVEMETFGRGPKGEGKEEL